MESQGGQDKQAAQGQKLNFVLYEGGYFNPRRSLSL